MFRIKVLRVATSAIDWATAARRHHRCPRDLRLDLTPALATRRERGIVCLQTGSGGRGLRPLPVTLDFLAFSGQFGDP